MENKLFSYIVKNDGGAAPNPYYGVCTMTICKPKIRKTAKVGDWVFGTGGKSSKCNDGKIHDLSNKLVIAMKVTGVLTIKEYYEFCKEHLPEKIPNWLDNDWRRKVGDCLYHYDENGVFRSVKGIHLQKGQKRDLSGVNTLLSTEFYYFGEKAVGVPEHLNKLVKKGQGYNMVTDRALIDGFESWIGSYEKNKIYGDPQFKWRFNKEAIYGF